jgi:hypothetical protein
MTTIRKNSNTKNSIKSTATIFVIIILLILCFGIAPGNNDVSTAKEPNAVSRQKQRQEEIKKQLSRSATGNFQTSLEMKENVDFVLTPALLVQEVISEDNVITYPSE